MDVGVWFVFSNQVLTQEHGFSECHLFNSLFLLLLSSFIFLELELCWCSSQLQTNLANTHFRLTCVTAAWAVAWVRLLCDSSGCYTLRLLFRSMVAVPSGPNNLSYHVRFSYYATILFSSQESSLTLCNYTVEVPNSFDLYTRSKFKSKLLECMF